MTEILTQSELLHQQIKNQGKLLVLKSVTGGMRKIIENHFELEVGGFLHNWFDLIGRIAISKGVIYRAANHARIIQSTPEINQGQKDQWIEKSLTDLFNPLVDEVLDRHEWNDFVKDWKKFLLMGYNQGGMTALQTMGFAAKTKHEVQKAVDDSGVITFELEDGEIIDSLNNRPVLYGSGIKAETITAARRIIKEEIYEGKGSMETAMKKLSTGEGVIEWMALRIAQTETQAAFSKAMYDTFSRSGVQKQSWLTVGDNRVRPQHVENEAAGPIEIGKPFPSGQLHPGDGILSIRCRCSTIPDLSDSKLVLQPWDGR